MNLGKIKDVFRGLEEIIFSDEVLRHLKYHRILDEYKIYGNNQGGFKTPCVHLSPNHHLAVSDKTHKCAYCYRQFTDEEYKAMCECFK